MDRPHHIFIISSLDIVHKGVIPGLVDVNVNPTTL